jgi:orotidine-5'-phosphate decarboxylase
MTEAPAPYKTISPKDRLIVALDVESIDEANAIIDELRDHVGVFKIGLQLFTLAGPNFVRQLAESGTKVFLDLKFHDIPNTVAKASVEAARLGVWMFNVHAAGGGEMMRRTAAGVSEVCDRENLTLPKILAVTVLTSSDGETLAEIGIETAVEDQVLKLGRLAAKCGMAGVVASPLEIKALRSAIADPKFLIVTPGVRPSFATNDDQKRVMTPGEAVAAGSDYIVVGRPVIKAADRRGAVAKIVEDISSTAN